MINLLKSWLLTITSWNAHDGRTRYTAKSIFNIHSSGRSGREGRHHRQSKEDDTKNFVSMKGNIVTFCCRLCTLIHDENKNMQHMQSRLPSLSSDKRFWIKPLEQLWTMSRRRNSEVRSRRIQRHPLAVGHSPCTRFLECLESNDAVRTTLPCLFWLERKRLL